MRIIGIMAAVGMVVPSVAVAQSASSSTADPVQNSSTASDPQSRPVMSTEGAAITDVVDAFDPGSVWSFRFTAGYTRSTRTAQLQRENATTSSLGTTMFDNVAHYNQVTQTLNLGAELAIFRDVAISFGLPIILSDTRGFSTSGGDVGGAALLDGFTQNPGTGAVPTSLFNLPFNSPERSGIDQIRLGLMFNITNQARDPWLPTWLLRFEWRIPVGAPLQACTVDASNHPVCPQALSDATAPNGMYDPANSNNYAGAYSRPLSSPANPGISRNVHGLYAQTVVARRIGYIEPYIGLDFLIELPNAGTDTFRFGDTPFGQLADIPPIQGSLMAGAEVTPWENRESWQRFSIDLRVLGKYFSQGRDYSPLFDALGSSNSIPLATPSYAINDHGSNTRPLYFTGTTGVQSHGAMTGQLGFAVQPARFLRFSFGGLLTYTTPYLMTATDACNPNQAPLTAGDAGGCVGNSVPDPLHRTVIDAPGQRLRFTDDITWDIYVNVSLTPRF